MGLGFIQLFAFGLNSHLEKRVETIFEFTETKLISFPLANFLRIKYLKDGLVF